MCDTYLMTPEDALEVGLAGVVAGPPLAWPALLPPLPGAADWYSQDTHPSGTWLYRPWNTELGMAEDVPVPCGAHQQGARVFCSAHRVLLEREYPQGWAYYPGDVCPHGTYTGGCGVDHMCHQCEMGDDAQLGAVWWAHVLVAVEAAGSVCDGCHEAPGLAGATAVADALARQAARAGVRGLVYYLEPGDGGTGHWYRPDERIEDGMA